MNGPQRYPHGVRRIPGYDYSQPGAYYVTIVTYLRNCIFGEVVDGQMILSDAGRIVEEEWLSTEKLRAEVKLDAYVVMPNHLHGIVLIEAPSGDSNPSGRQSLTRIVNGFKAAVTRRISALIGLQGTSVWQRSFHDHVIRDERSLERIREYVAGNPMGWETDEENPRRSRRAAPIV
jgi:REP element-mobilizing transposase RayT